jgi:hypothetical protein
MPGSQTPNYCTVASNSLCNKDFFARGKHITSGYAGEIDTKYDFETGKKREALEDYLTIR